MSAFTGAELAYLGEGRLARLATVDEAGMPHLVPLGFTYNPVLDCLDVGGRDFARTAKYRHAALDPHVALLVDDVLPPWRRRAVMIRGHAEALTDATDATGRPTGPIIRIHPTQVISWGLGGVDTTGTPATHP